MKKPTPKFKAKVENGLVKLADPKRMERLLEGFEGKNINVILKRYTKQRTQNQNAYFFGGVLTPISDSTGHDVDELFMIFKDMFLDPVVTNYRGKKVTLVGGTSELDTVGFGEFIDKVIREAADMGIVIQSPEEYYASFDIE